MFQMFLEGDKSDLQAGQFSIWTHKSRILYEQNVFCHCVAEISKTFPEEDVIWMLQMLLINVFTCILLSVNACYSCQVH